MRYAEYCNEHNRIPSTIIVSLLILVYSQVIFYILSENSPVLSSNSKGCESNRKFNIRSLKIWSEKSHDRPDSYGPIYVSAKKITLLKIHFYFWCSLKASCPHNGSKVFCDFCVRLKNRVMAAMRLTMKRLLFYYRWYWNLPLKHYHNLKLWNISC